MEYRPFISDPDIWIKDCDTHVGYKYVCIDCWRKQRYDLKESAQGSIVQCLHQLHSLYVGYVVCLSRSQILGLRPYTLYYQVALNIVNCQ
jgi:hypothetical protein